MQGLRRELRREFRRCGGSCCDCDASCKWRRGASCSMFLCKRCGGSCSTAGAAVGTAVERAVRRELHCRGRKAALHSALSVRRLRLATGLAEREALVGPEYGECGGREVAGKVLTT